MCAASSTAPATASATSPASAPGCRTSRSSAWTASGSARSTPRRSTTTATTSPTTSRCDPSYGDLEEFDRLVRDAHRLGLKVLIDIVPNHCSSEHPWFRAALAAARQPGPGAVPLRRRPRRGRRTAAQQLARHVRRPAWSRVTEPDGAPGQWYLHMFTPEQPDLNWRDPAVGSRLRAGAALLARPGRRRLPHRCGRRAVQAPRAARLRRPARPTSAPATPSTPGLEPARGARGVAPLARDLRGVHRRDGHDRLLVGEVSVRTPHEQAATSRPTNCTRPSSSTCCAPPGTPTPSARSSPRR